MKKLDLSLISTYDLVQEDQYLLTQKELELLNKGELTFYNGNLYRTKDVPREIPTIDLTPDESLPLLNLYGDEKLLKDVPDPLANKHLSDKGDFAAQCLHPSFNQPTQAQIERCKQFPQVEIKGVHLKSSKLNTKGKQAADQLLETIRINGDKHPYTWVGEARMLADFAGNGSIPFLLEILNAAIPLKEGMKLESFSVREFEQKHLHTRPSLLEAWTAGDAQLIDNIRKENDKLVPRPVDTNQVVENPSYLSLEVEGMENTHIKELEVVLRELYCNFAKDKVGNFQDFTQSAGMLYNEYKGHVYMLDPDDFDPDLTKWTIAIHLQHAYWEQFRGRTITILKLFNKFLNPDNELYHLETPIPGMKKR